MVHHTHFPSIQNYILPYSDTVCVCLLTVGPGQVLVKFLAVLLMQDVVHAGVDELLLLVLQVLGDVVGHEHDAALPVHHKQKAVQSLGSCDTYHKTFLSQYFVVLL